MRPLFCGYSNMPSFPAANTGRSLDVQLWIHARLYNALCRKGGEKATSRRKGLLAKWPSQRPYIHATDMRISWVARGERGVGVGASSTAFRSPRAAENQFRAPAWTVRVDVDGGLPSNASKIREFC
jgi:hypothetical protein